MMRALAAAALLLALGACGTSPAVEHGPRTRQLPPAPPPPDMPAEPVACAADVKPCPDGRFVSRNPAKNCAFDACPGASNN